MRGLRCPFQIGQRTVTAQLIRSLEPERVGNGQQGVASLETALHRQPLTAQNKSECLLQLCDVLKYSTQRARSFSELLRDHEAHLEIETLGEDGLRFRTRHSFGAWNSVPAFEVKIKDTAGSGDWTSVGLIASMFRNGREDLVGTSKEDISSFLEHSQALAALNCQFEGARGAMYQMSRSRFMDTVASLESKRPERRRQRKISLACLFPTSSVCPRCKPHKPVPESERIQKSNAPAAVSDLC